MGRVFVKACLPLFALLIAGASSCDPTLVSPKNGHLFVEHVLSPVRIQTSRLKGTGRLEALKPSGTWTLIHFEPGGAFVYDEPLPISVWHCSDPGATEGCVARLRVGHDPGPIGPNPVFGTGIVHVCTENYVQRQGRRHCGARSLEEQATLGSFAWQGDPWNRVILGSHAFQHANADSPPTGDAASQTAGVFHDFQWKPDSAEANLELGAPPKSDWAAYSLDIGACSFFIPWEWEHRLESAYYTAGLGAALGNRGLAELFLDEMIDTTEPQSQTEVNAMLWVDAVVGIDPNTNASPEFHYRLSPDTEEPQICFKQYFHASSDISTKPDHWYRFDQAIGAFFLEILPFVGRCGSKNVSFRYCGTPEVVDGAGIFELDPSSVQIAHQGYPWGKTVCNNQFVPQLIDGIRATFEPGGEGADQIDMGVAVLVESLSETLGLDVRRIEMSPRGVYLITAENTADPQYGLGDCRPDLGRSPPAPGATRASETEIHVGARGLTRF
jgi:hypothetical protein